MLSAITLQSIQGRLNRFLRQGFCETCPLCGRSTKQNMCHDCWRQVLSCQQLTPLPTTANSPPILVWGRYEGSLKRAIAQMKYQGHPSIATCLGEELGLRWLKTFPRCPSFQVIPIPLHRDRLAKRGYNQAELIARRFSQVIGMPYRQDGLVRVRQTQAQHNLDPMHRAKNLKGVFTLGPGLKNFNQPALLIDDIFTTGATTHEARTILEKANVKVLGTAVVAQAIFEAN